MLNRGANLRTPTLGFLAAAILAGCGVQPPRSAAPSGPASVPGTGTEATAPATPTTGRKPGTVVQKRGGGYYKDDGPGDEIPDNLDEIPDAVPRWEPLHRFANNPYVVLGKSYVPYTVLKPMRQRGVASWYGKKFHGQKTSIGEPYDMFAMTAAHPTLAIPSYVRVTNVSNGKSVVLRVTDRGPFHADRIIDLSYAAAYRLGYVNNGSTVVEVESIVPDGSSDSQTLYADAKPVAIEPAKSPTKIAAASEPDEIELLTTRLAGEENAKPSPNGGAASSPANAARGVFLQLGAFSSADNAESLRSHLSRELDWLNEGIEIIASGGMHRVHLGPYASRADAEKVAVKIAAALGYKPAFVRR